MLFLKFAALLSLAQSLPDGPGKAVTERMCKPCHGLENVVREKRTKDRWTEVVDDMVSRGAQGTDAEIDQVIDYLTANFGANAARTINVNKASASELITALGLSTADADAIVHYRAEKGAFKSIQDLMKVPGIEAKKIESVQNRIEF
jgi:competence ComEA-like helix-hairpin-helix protein